MARVVVVHGVGQEFLGPELMAQQVGPALRDGVRLASGPRLDPSDVSCAFYGDIYFEPGMRGTDLPPWDEHDVEEGLEAELLAAWWEAAARTDPAVPPPDDTDTRGLVGFAGSRALLSDRVREALVALAASPFFAKVSDRLLIFALKQVRRYLSEPDIRRSARERIAAEITDDTRVLVAHSLGSVIAYEALCAHPDWPVTDLVTVGSPLGLPIVFDRLDPAPADGTGAWPGAVDRWTNIADPGDIVALVHTLAPRFGDRVSDRRIHNGTAMHDLLRYLTARTTGAAVAAGLDGPATKDAGSGDRAS
ncbi:hypothetical protein [Streptomyces caeruleatus]|uniref:Antibiotic ABC transporter ATP-binding protein n=1 Tax=Streptomyces caeruleatus TaxID=661399 RepID=A0A117RQS2_9ACTN|nr:hypothetical protein [Streptomyces caeruleatus]KUO04144.1 hypothetical protein AQJ67_12870 [Streptomyces caeruleatus]